MDREKVLNLAKLSRIELKDGEAESLSHEFDVILGYVGEIRNVIDNQPLIVGKNTIHNIVREDNNSHESSIYTEKILEQAPAREGDYIKVKKIL